jgi:hypothetical protein
VGSSIYCFFARGSERNAAELRTTLDDLMAEHHEDVRVVRERGRFSEGGGGWHLTQDRQGGEHDCLSGEGPAGFSIEVYRQVIRVGSAERFGAVYDVGSGVAPALRHILSSMARRLGASHQVAVAAAGYGDTDRAGDVAYYEGASFQAVVAMLVKVAGPPARSWDELAGGNHRWYLGVPTEDSRVI